MISSFCNKMLEYFGNEGLIIYSKSNDYFNKCNVNIEDIKMFYELCLENNGPFSNNPYILNYLACTIYYQALENKEFENYFYNKFITRLNLTDPVEKPNLYFIFNIIEIEDKFRLSQQNQIQFLIQYLNKFVALSKTLEEFLLFKYYSGLLNLYLKNLAIATTQSIEIVSNLNDEVGNEKMMTPFLKYISIKNDIFYLRIAKEDNNNDLNEYLSLALTTFNQMKESKKNFALKIGISIFDIYKKKNDYENCKIILENLNSIINRELLSGENIENGLEFYLAIASRMAYIATFFNDAKLLKSSIKKLRKTIEILQIENQKNNNNDNNNKYITIKSAYDFIILIFNSNNLFNNDNNFIINSQKYNEIINNFKSSFLHLDNQNNYIQTNYLFNQLDIYESIMNICALNNFDILTQTANVRLNNLINKIKNNELIKPSDLLTFTIGIYNNICNLNISLFNDPNKAKQIEYKKEIQNYSSLIIDYVQKNYEFIALFNIPFIKNIIVKIIVIYLNTFLIDKNYNEYEKINDEIEEKFKFYLDFNDEKLLGKYFKEKGDYYLKTNKIDKALNEYNKAIKGFEKKDNNRAVILFNLGIIYFFKNDKKKCEDNLNLCLDTYNKITQQIDKKNDNNNILKKNNINYAEKIKIVENILNKLHSN